MALIEKSTERMMPPAERPGTTPRSATHQWRIVAAAPTSDTADYFPQFRIARIPGRKPPVRPNRLIWTQRDEEIFQAMQPPPFS